MLFFSKLEGPGGPTELLQFAFGPRENLLCFLSTSRQACGILEQK